MEKMSEIISEYKQILMTDKLESGETEYYTDQVKNLFTTMNAIANLADVDYKEKKILEDAEEKETEKQNVIDYNKSYGISPRETLSAYGYPSREDGDYSIDRF